MDIFGLEIKKLFWLLLNSGLPVDFGRVAIDYVKKLEERGGSTYKVYQNVLKPIY